MTGQASLLDTLDVLLRFGALTLRAGEAAFRVRETMKQLAPRLGIDDFAMLLTITTMTATARRGREHVTVVRQVGPLGVNSWRLQTLERLALASRSPLAPADLNARLDGIEAVPRLHDNSTAAFGVGLASAAFAWLNGGDLAAMIAAFVGGALGQWLRLLLLQRRLNQFVVTGLCGLAAGVLYCVAAALLVRIGLVPSHGIGVIAAALFLVPGFPLVAALLDLLQHQTAAGLARLTYGLLLVLAGGFGVVIVVAAMGFAPPTAPVPVADPVVNVLLRGFASFVAGCGFAMLYNSSWRTVLLVGGLSLGGNEVRLALQDLGAAQAVATLAGVLVIGLLTSVAQRRLHDPRIVLAVPAILVMAPGAIAFESITLLCHGETLAGLQAALMVGFVIGAIALGLALARFVSERHWLFED